MQRWYSLSNHGVKIVLLAKFDGTKILLEKWEEEMQDRPGTTMTPFVIPKFQVPLFRDKVRGLFGLPPEVWSEFLDHLLGMYHVVLQDPLNKLRHPDGLFLSRKVPFELTGQEAQSYSLLDY
jgi:hypothetical protein